MAVYARQQLNIRITANFLLALAASQPSTKPHVRRYFCAAVQLPSDWLEVVRISSTVSTCSPRSQLYDFHAWFSTLSDCLQCFSTSLPTCLKKAMADKFKEFTEYQLAKYNTRKHRCKHHHKKATSKVRKHGCSSVVCCCPSWLAVSPDSLGFRKIVTSSQTQEEAVG